MVKNIYIYGSPGGGKTFIVNLLFSLLNKKRNKNFFLRIHFQEFMAMVHEKINLHRKRKSKNPLINVATDICTKHKVIIFDELEILDIADAMIVSKLFYTLIKKGVSFIITSNYKPKDLYKNGLQRSQFEPFINLIYEEMTILELNNTVDLRLMDKEVSRLSFLSPLNEDTKTKFDNLFYKNKKNKKPIEKRIISLGREVILKKTFSDAVFFDFDNICSYKFSPNDYIKISSEFKTIFINNIPLLERNKLNEIRRFIILIDILYERKNNLIVRSEKNLLNMFAIKKIKIPFQRTLSRISEMTSVDWVNN